MTLTRFVVPIAALTVALVSVLSATVRTDSPAAVTTVTASQPPATCTVPAPSTAAGYQAMLDAKNDRTWSGGDQATSTQLPDGRTLWLFGDTVQADEATDGSYAADMRIVHNSFLLQDGGCLEAVNGPDGREVVPDAANGDFYWPQQALVDDGRLVVLALRVRRTGSGAYDFQTRGMEAALFSLPSSPTGEPRFDRMAVVPSSGTPDTSPQYGAAVVSDGHYHYLYGTARVAAPLHFGRSVYVARTPVGELLHPGAWTYWSGSTWSQQPSSARPFVDSAPAGWSTAFTVLRTPDGAYRVVTKENEFLGTDVITGVADSPVGPFTREVVGKYPSYARPRELLYLAAAHPEARVEGGMLATINRNTEDLAMLRSDADLYKPQFFTIPAA